MIATNVNRGFYDPSDDHGDLGFRFKIKVVRLARSQANNGDALRSGSRA